MTRLRPPVTPTGRSANSTRTARGRKTRKALRSTLDIIEDPGAAQEHNRDAASLVVERVTLAPNGNGGLAPEFVFRAL